MCKATASLLSLSHLTQNTNSAIKKVRFPRLTHWITTGPANSSTIFDPTEDSTRRQTRGVGTLWKQLNKNKSVRYIHTKHVFSPYTHSVHYF